MTIAVVGVLGIILVYYMSNAYKDYAYEHHSEVIQQLARLETSDLKESLKSNSLDLALTIGNDKAFRQSFDNHHSSELTRQLNNQFQQYFVTAGILRLLKLYVLDTEFTLLSKSTEGIDVGNELICPQLSQAALTRRGSERLQTISRSCNYHTHPVFAVIVPYGGLNPRGYIQVVTDLAHNMQKLETSLAMPIKIQLLDGQTLFLSENWSATQDNPNYLTVDLPILDEGGNTVMNILLNSDMTDFNHQIHFLRNLVMALVVVITALTILIVLRILHHTALPPLARLKDLLEKINTQQYINEKGSRPLFEQLLENIILLRKNSHNGFSVMLIDLNCFDNINSEHGETIDELLLIEVEKRLRTILIESDLISCAGPAIQGQVQPPADSAIPNRATIARLGGDELGLLLPMTQTSEQAYAIAESIVETLDKSFYIHDQKIDIDCRIGISIFPDHGHSNKTLINRANKAMLQARANNHTILVFDGSARQ